jgi:hypothetical protein
MAGLADQGNLSRILNGKAGISKNLAKRLADYFSVSGSSFSNGFPSRAAAAAWHLP